MAKSEQSLVAWEHKQAELWDRIFQATGDATALANELDDDAGGAVAKEELIRTAMRIGLELVRANAADTDNQFREAIERAKLAAVEVDYWLRLSYVLQQRDDIQRDLSGLITQYASIIDLLDRSVSTASQERATVKRSRRATKIPS